MQLHALGQLVGLGQAKGVFCIGVQGNTVYGLQYGNAVWLGGLLWMWLQLLWLVPWRSVCLGLNLVASGC